MRHVFTIVVFGAISLSVLAGRAQATQFEIDFKLSTNAAYSGLQFRVAYTNALGNFVGSASSVSCTGNSALNALVAFNDIDSTKILNEGFIATTPFQGPIVLATCVFDRSSGTPTTSQFTITIDDWTASHSQAPSVIISRIEAVP